MMNSKSEEEDANMELGSKDDQDYDKSSEISSMQKRHKEGYNTRRAAVTNYLLRKYGSETVKCNKKSALSLKNEDENQSIIYKKKGSITSSQQDLGSKNQKISLIGSKEENIINKANLEKKLNEIASKCNLSIDFSNEIVKVMSNGLGSFMQKTIRKLIEIARIRNVSFNLFSRNQNEKYPTFKIHTFNSTNDNNSNNNNQMNQIGFIPYNDFSILFTKNIKSDFNLIEQYHELNMKKLKIERFSIYKSKIEEIAKEKGGDTKIKITNTLNPIKLGPGRRTRKRDSAMIKTIRNNFAKSQKKEDLDRQKSYTMNTLDTFLDNKPKNIPQSLSGTMINARFDVEMSSMKESHLETFTKMSEVSKSENPIINNESNEVSLSIFKNNNIGEHIQLYGTSKKKIILKDLVFFLEKSNDVPLKMLLLQKVMIAMTQGH